MPILHGKETTIVSHFRSEPYVLRENSKARPRQFHRWNRWMNFHSCMDSENGEPLFQHVTIYVHSQIHTHWVELFLYYGLAPLKFTKVKCLLLLALLSFCSAGNYYVFHFDLANSTQCSVQSIIFPVTLLLL
jgi:hypothetical protein